MTVNSIMLMSFLILTNATGQELTLESIMELNKKSMNMSSKSTKKLMFSEEKYIPDGSLIGMKNGKKNPFKRINKNMDF